MYMICDMLLFSSDNVLIIDSYKEKIFILFRKLMCSDMLSYIIERNFYLVVKLHGAIIHSAKF